MPSVTCQKSKDQTRYKNNVMINFKENAIKVPLEFLGFFNLVAASFSNHVSKISSEYEWNALSTNPKLHFKVTQEVTKIDM